MAMNVNEINHMYRLIHHNEQANRHSQQIASCYYLEEFLRRYPSERILCTLSAKVIPVYQVRSQSAA